MRQLPIALAGAGLLLVVNLHAATRDIPLNDVSKLELRGVKAETVEYKGKQALKLTEQSQARDVTATQLDSLAQIKGISFTDGTIEVEASGAPSAKAGEGARGFVGVAFRTSADVSKYEYFYLRPTNGRVEDQVRRNHSAQYASHPDYPWQRLRKEEPEKYETYVDLEPGVWTKLRIVVAGNKAKLYVHGNAQPTLVVNDLKLGASTGGIALWVGPGTEAHFADLKVID